MSGKMTYEKLRESSAYIYNADATNLYGSGMVTPKFIHDGEKFRYPIGGLLILKVISNGKTGNL